MTEPNEFADRWRCDECKQLVEVAAAWPASWFDFDSFWPPRDDSPRWRAASTRGGCADPPA